MPKLLPKKAVCEKVGFSRAHVDRLSNDPEYAQYNFPKSVKIGFKVFWCEDELDEWIISWLAKRAS